MLESIFILTVIVAVVFMILGIEKESVIYAGISMLFWIIVMAGQIVIEVPITDATYYKATANAYFYIALGCIFINILWQILLYFEVVGKAKEDTLTDLYRQNPKIPYPGHK